MNANRFFIALALTVLFAMSSNAQLRPHDFKRIELFKDILEPLNVKRAYVSWADYDDDGDLDILLALDKEIDGVEKKRRYLFTNKGNYKFKLKRKFKGRVSWVDYDGDGDVDLYRIGKNRDGKKVLVMFINQTKEQASAGSKTVSRGKRVANPDDKPLFVRKRLYTFDTKGYIAGHWGRYNKGKKLDFFCRIDGAYYCLKNEGRDRFSKITTSIESKSGTALSFVDFDKDGDDDVIRTAGFRTEFYRKDGRNYERLPKDPNDIVNNNIPKASVVKGTDYNNDGKVDIAVATKDKVTIYKNHGEATMPVYRYGKTLKGFGSYSKIQWGDLDMDGDQDLLISGFGTTNTNVYRYKNGRFEYAQVLKGNDPKWGDVDGDGDQDILMIGANVKPDRDGDVYRYYIYIYENKKR